MERSSTQIKDYDLFASMYKDNILTDRDMRPIHELEERHGLPRQRNK